MTVELSLGNFAMQIDVLNCLMPLLIDDSSIVGRGTFGAIYEAYVSEKKVAIKTVNIVESRLESNFL